MSISGISGMDSYYYLSQLMRQSGSSSSSSSSSLSDLFSSIDTNGDGSISEGELEACLENQGGSLTNSVMGSGTDSASLVSLLQDAAQLDSATGTATSVDELFGKLDTNGDGSISKSELESYASSLSTQSGNGTSSTSGSDTSAIDQLFSAIDTNGDGSISKSELEAFASQVESAMSAPPPPEPMSSLDSLLRTMGSESGSYGSAGSAASASSTAAGSSETSSTTTSDQTNSVGAEMAILMEAISKYMQFGQAATGSASTLSVSG